MLCEDYIEVMWDSVSFISGLHRDYVRIKYGSCRDYVRVIYGSSCRVL